VGGKREELRGGTRENAISSEREGRFLIDEGGKVAVPDCPQLEGGVKLLLVAR